MSAEIGGDGELVGGVQHKHAATQKGRNVEPETGGGELGDDGGKRQRGRAAENRDGVQPGAVLAVRVAARLCRLARVPRQTQRKVVLMRHAACLMRVR